MKRIALPLLLLGLGACRRLAATAYREPLQSMEGFSLRQSYRGGILWDLKASRAILREDAHQANLSNPNVDVYKNGKIATRITSRQGLLKTNTHDMFLSSSVVVNSLDDDSVLKTEALQYSSDRQKFHTDQEVLVMRPGGVVHGRGMEANSDLSEIRIFEQTSTVEKRK